MEASLRRFVQERAEFSCEYCRIKHSQLVYTSFHIEHIVARQHGGRRVPDNLAYSCQHCNLHKGPNLSGIDPDTGAVVNLFNPRTDDWRQHFDTEDQLILGKTATGRATVWVLDMNAEQRVRMRQRLALADELELE